MWFSTLVQKESMLLPSFLLAVRRWWDGLVPLGMSAAAAALWSCDAGRRITGIAGVLALVSLVTAPLLQYCPSSWFPPRQMLLEDSSAKAAADEAAPAGRGAAAERRPRKAQRQAERRRQQRARRGGGCEGAAGPEEAEPRRPPGAPAEPEAEAVCVASQAPGECAALEPQAAGPAAPDASMTAVDAEEFFDPEPPRPEVQQSLQGDAAAEEVAVHEAVVEEVSAPARPEAADGCAGSPPLGAAVPPLKAEGSGWQESSRSKNTAPLATPCLRQRLWQHQKLPSRRQSFSGLSRGTGHLSPWRSRRSASCPAHTTTGSCTSEELPHHCVLSRDSADPAQKAELERPRCKNSPRSSNPRSRLEDTRRREELEDELLSCEEQLEALERRLVHMVSEPSRRRSSDALQSRCVGGDGEDAPVQTWHADCRELVSRLEDLAADALERSCSRDTTGAMDVFEQANTAVDRMAGMLRRLSDAQVEAGAPEWCDPVEWRLVAGAVNSRLELETLHSLMAQVQDCNSHPACASGGSLLSQQPGTLLRFLRAKQGSAEEAAEMFRTSLDWRQSTAIKEWNLMWSAEMSAGSTWRARLVKKYQVHTVIGTDRLGLPVYLFRWSVFDIAGAERELGQELVVRIILSIHEEVVAAMRKATKRSQTLAPGVLYVWDVGNYSRHGVPHWFSRMWALVRFLPRVAQQLEANYPEVVRKIMVLRCNVATKTLYRAVSPLMPSRTLGKCHLYGWRASEWLQDLRRELPDGELPAFLERDDEDVLAKAFPRGGIYPAGAAAAAQAAEEAQRAAAQLAGRAAA